MNLTTLLSLLIFFGSNGHASDWSASTSKTHLRFINSDETKKLRKISISAYTKDDFVALIHFNIFEEGSSGFLETFEYRRQLDQAACRKLRSLFKRNQILFAWLYRAPANGE